jgi:hypothetical protein
MTNMTNAQLLAKNAELAAKNAELAAKLEGANIAAQNASRQAEWESMMDDRQ